jgi:hypothetical protein
MNKELFIYLFIYLYCISRPRPVVPPKPVISRQLVQNLINNAAAAAAANSPADAATSHSGYNGRPATATMAYLGLPPPPMGSRRPITASKSLESLLSDQTQPSACIERQSSAVHAPLGNLADTRAAEAWTRHPRLYSGSDNEHHVAAGEQLMHQQQQRSSTLPAGAERLLDPHCDIQNSNADGSCRQIVRSTLTAAILPGQQHHVSGGVGGHHHVAGDVTPGFSQWRSRSMHQLHLAPPDVSPGFQLERFEYNGLNIF